MHSFRNSLWLKCQLLWSQISGTLPFGPCTISRASRYCHENLGHGSEAAHTADPSGVHRDQSVDRHHIYFGQQSSFPHGHNCLSHFIHWCVQQWTQPGCHWHTLPLVQQVHNHFPGGASSGCTQSSSLVSSIVLNGPGCFHCRPLCSLTDSPR